MEDIEHQRAKHVGTIPARFVMRNGKQYHLVTGLPVRTISGDDSCVDCGGYSWSPEHAEPIEGFRHRFNNAE